MDSPAPFDNFSVRDVAGPFEFDGRWFSEHGEVQVDAANSNLLEITSTNSFHMHVIRRGMRAGKYVATARFKWNASAHPGLAARWIGPSDSAYVAISPTDGKARLFLRESGAGTTLATSSTVLSLTTNNWYTMKLVIGDDLANSALQRLRFWVDTDDDGDWSAETALLDSTAIDDEWSAGSVGLYRGGPAAQQFDDFRSGYDNNADLDIDDAGDDVLISDDFATNVVSPTYDNNGNTTFDGVFSYTFDGWNRRRLTKLGAEGDALTVQEFAWFPTGRMATRANTNLGVENTAKDGGNITVRHYFAGRTLVEERNGSAQATRQYLWSSGQLVWMDTNGDPSIGSDTSPDTAASGEGSESPADKRHFYTYNAQHRIVALTDYTPGGGGNNGRIAERVIRGAHGGRIIIDGNSGSGELGSGRPTSNFASGFSDSEPSAAERIDASGSFMSAQSAVVSAIVIRVVIGGIATVGCLANLRSCRIDVEREHNRCMDNCANRWDGEPNTSQRDLQLAACRACCQELSNEDYSNCIPCGTNGPDGDYGTCLDAFDRQWECPSGTFNCICQGHIIGCADSEADCNQACYGTDCPPNQHMCYCSNSTSPMGCVNTNAECQMLCHGRPVDSIDTSGGPPMIDVH